MPAELSALGGQGGVGGVEDGVVGAVGDHQVVAALLELRLGGVQGLPGAGQVVAHFGLVIGGPAVAAGGPHR